VQLKIERQPQNEVDKLPFPLLGEVNGFYSVPSPSPQSPPVKGGEEEVVSPVKGGGRRKVEPVIF
jgi:hypothetical protein